MAGLAMNSAIVALLAEPLSAMAGRPELGTAAAKAAATAVVLGWNFLANRHWTFIEEAEEE